MYLRAASLKMTVWSPPSRFFQLLISKQITQVVTVCCGNNRDTSLCNVCNCAGLIGGADLIHNDHLQSWLQW